MNMCNNSVQRLLALCNKTKHARFVVMTESNGDVKFFQLGSYDKFIQLIKMTNLLYFPFFRKKKF